MVHPFAWLLRAATPFASWLTTDWQCAASRPVTLVELSIDANDMVMTAGVGRRGGGEGEGRSAVGAASRRAEIEDRERERERWRE